MIDLYSFSSLLLHSFLPKPTSINFRTRTCKLFAIFFNYPNTNQGTKKICQCSNSIEVPCREHPAVNFTISLGVQSQDMMRMKLLMMMKMWVFCCPPCEMPYNMWSLNDLLRFTLFLLPLLLFLSPLLLL